MEAPHLTIRMLNLQVPRLWEGNKQDHHRQREPIYKTGPKKLDFGHCNDSTLQDNMSHLRYVLACAKKS